MVVVSSNFAAPVEGVLFQAPATKLIINDQELGTGTLYITENNVVWGNGVLPSGGSASTISLLYPTISMHAVQREPSTALFVVVNYDLRLPELQQAGSGDAAEEDEDDEFDPDDQPITQLRFIPQNEGDLQAMYSAMVQGQSLHPDPADQDDDDDDMDDDGPYMDGEEFDDGSEEFLDAEESLAPEDTASRLRQLRLQHNGDNGEADNAEVEEE